MEQISQHRFRILTLGRDPMADALLSEMEWYRDRQEVVIGTVYIDHTDRDWGYVVLGRDEIGQFRWINGGASYDTPEEARIGLDAATEVAIESGDVTFPQGDEADRKFNDLMQPVYPNER